MNHGTLPRWLKPANRLVKLLHRAGLRRRGGARAVLRACPVEVPHGVSFFIKVGAVSGVTPEEFAAAAPGCAVFRVVPA